MGRGIKQMAELAVTNLVELTLRHAGLHIGHQPHPQRHLGTIQRGLLDNALGTVGNIVYYYSVGLIGCIA